MRITREARAKQIKGKQKTLLERGLNIQLFAGTGATRISDVIVPAIFAGYMNREPLELNAFYQSGIMVRTAEFDSLVSGGGYAFTLPYWDELEGEYEDRTDTDNGLPVFNKITTKKEVAVKLFDKYAAGASQLASELAGADAIRAIKEKFNHKISNLDQKRILSLLKGVFASPAMASNVLDITTRVGAAQNFSVATIIEGQGLLGDRQQSFTGLAMHSTVYTYLKMKNLITTQKESEQGQEISLYSNKRVIIDDTLAPTAAGVYTTYLFARGAIAYGRGGEKYPIESGKIPFMEEEGLLVRKNHTFHVRGTTWKGSIDDKCTVAQIETAANWDKAYSHKQIPVVALRHKVDLTEFTSGVRNGAEEIGKAISLGFKGIMPEMKEAFTINVVAPAMEPIKEIQNEAPDANVNEDKGTPKAEGKAKTGKKNEEGK